MCFSVFFSLISICLHRSISIIFSPTAHNLHGGSGLFPGQVPALVSRLKTSGCSAQPCVEMFWLRATNAGMGGLALQMSCIASRLQYYFYVSVFLCLSIYMRIKITLPLCGNLEMQRYLPGDWQATQEPKTFLILQFPRGLL